MSNISGQIWLSLPSCNNPKCTQSPEEYLDYGRLCGICIRAIESIEKIIAQEHRDIRAVYDHMEEVAGTDSMEGNRPFVTFRGWKMIRNVITDRIEELTGERQ